MSAKTAAYMRRAAVFKDGTHTLLRCSSYTTVSIRIIQSQLEIRQEIRMKKVRRNSQTRLSRNLNVSERLFYRRTAGSPEGVV
jgi:hypothetical protein